MKIDFDAVVGRHPLKQTLQGMGMKFTGTKCKCPFHDDRTASLNTYTKKDGSEGWKCHGCGKTGDVVEFVAQFNGVSKKDAVAILEGQAPQTGTALVKAPSRRSNVPAAAKRAYTPIPNDFSLPRMGIKFPYRESKDGRDKTSFRIPTRIHHYFDDSGQNLLGITVRSEFINSTGKRDKSVLPYRYFEGHLYNEGWGKEEGFPIFGRERLISWPSLPVVVVEGEKNVEDALQAGLQSYVWLAWQSGTENVVHVDWSCLQGRDVILWPDHDKGGYKAMKALADILQPIAASITVLRPEKDWPEKYDVSDFIHDLIEAGKTAADVVAWMKDPAHYDVVKSDRIRSLRQEASPPDWSASIHWTMTKDDTLALTDESNIYEVLTNHPDLRGSFQYDTFDRELLFRGTKFTTSRAHELSNEIRRMWPHVRPKAAQLQEMGMAIAEANPTSRFRDYLMSLLGTWDGVSRVAPSNLAAEGQGLLPMFARVRPDPFSRIVGMRWMMGVVGRVLRPGMQHDGILVLEGAQGFRKTSFFRRLGQVNGMNLHVDFASSSMGKDKDDMMRMAGKAVVEMGEMTAHRRSEQDLFKNFTTLTHDTYRPPYAREAQTFPRQHVYCGTTNEESSYLSDTTGNRRIWPARVTGEIDVEAMTDEVLEQIWAEAVHLFVNEREPNHLVGQEVEWHAEIIEGREKVDPWSTAIYDYLVKNGFNLDTMPIREQFIWEALLVPVERRSQALKDRMVKVMAAEPFNMRERRGQASEGSDRSKAFRRDRRSKRPRVDLDD